MEVRDASYSLCIDKSLRSQEEVIRSSPRVNFATERTDLMKEMRRSFATTSLELDTVCSVGALKSAVCNEQCDLAIVDIESHSEWPETIFSDFDEMAATFPVIILCRKKTDVLNYVRKARYAFDIFSYDTVGDARLLSVVEASMFRASTRKGLM